MALKGIWHHAVPISWMLSNGDCNRLGDPSATAQRLWKKIADESIGHSIAALKKRELETRWRQDLKCCRNMEETCKLMVNLSFRRCAVGPPMLRIRKRTQEWKELSTIFCKISEKKLIFTLRSMKSWKKVNLKTMKSHGNEAQLFKEKNVRNLGFRNPWTLESLRNPVIEILEIHRMLKRMWMKN